MRIGGETVTQSSMVQALQVDRASAPPHHGIASFESIYLVIWCSCKGIMVVPSEFSKLMNGLGLISHSIRDAGGIRFIIAQVRAWMHPSLN